MMAAQVAAALALEPHREGGYFRETYRSPLRVATPAGPRPAATAILYLLTAESPSRFHRLRFDEIWFYHAGAPAELFLLGGAAGGATPGADRLLVAPDSPQVLVPGGRWMGGRVVPGAPGGAPTHPGWTLVGCVVTPGFEYEDFELGRQDELVAAFPAAADLIRVLS